MMPAVGGGKRWQTLTLGAPSRRTEMNKSLVGALIVAAALMVMGCDKSSEKGGGTGSDTFRIVVPGTVANVNQGEMVIVRLTLERGTAFKQPVTLDVKAPDGIQVGQNAAKVQPGDNGDVQLKITAAKDAALGEHKIFVKGTPDVGEPTETEFRINVRAK
jgi:hypothetical protein